MKKAVTFDMIVVGTGGGPDECNLSAYLVKPRDTAWEDGIIGLEAGSGQGALARILSQHPDLLQAEGEVDGPTYSAGQIYSYVRSFLISHAHMDHVASLVLGAGSMGGKRKSICATGPVLRDLESVFSNRLWPKLASWNETDDPHNFLYNQLHADAKYKTILPQVSVRSMSVSHGCNDEGTYESTAFFIRHDLLGREFLFFGDVEADSISTEPRLLHVWRVCAPKIPDVLSAIFIECSWSIERPDELLFGHLKPEHLVSELLALATEVVDVRQSGIKTGPRTTRPPARKKRKKNPQSHDLRGVLDGLRVYITHCKEDMTGPLNVNRDLIVQQVKDLVDKHGLGAEVFVVKQGSRIEI